jgi:lipopolysaccharide export system permease protein
MIAVIAVFGIINRHNELTALKGGGVSPVYILAPVIAFACTVAFLMFFVSEAVSPLTTAKANQIREVEIRKTAAVAAGKKNIWIKGDRQIVHVSYYDPASKTIHGISVYRFDERFRPELRVDAEMGEYLDSKWRLKDAMVISTKNGQDSVSVLSEDAMSMDLGFTPKEAKAASVKSEEMGFRDLVKYINKVESEGYDATVYRVDLMAKISFPFAAIIMAVAGVTIASKRKFRERMPISIGIGLIVLFSYWTLHGFSVSLGYGGMLPSFIAAWSANLVFSCASIYFFLSPEE